MRYHQRTDTDESPSTDPDPEGLIDDPWLATYAHALDATGWRIFVHSAVAFSLHPPTRDQPGQLGLRCRASVVYRNQVVGRFAQNGDMADARVLWYESTAAVTFVQAIEQARTGADRAMAGRGDAMRGGNTAGERAAVSVSRRATNAVQQLVAAKVFRVGADLSRPYRDPPKERPTSAHPEH